MKQVYLDLRGHPAVSNAVSNAPPQTLAFECRPVQASRTNHAPGAARCRGSEDSAPWHRSKPPRRVLGVCCARRPEEHRQPNQAGSTNGQITNSPTLTPAWASVVPRIEPVRRATQAKSRPTRKTKAWSRGER